MHKFIKKPAREVFPIIALDISSTDTGVAVVINGSVRYHSHFAVDQSKDYRGLLDTARDLAAAVFYHEPSLTDYPEVYVFPEQVFIGPKARHAMLTPLIMHGILMREFDELITQRKSAMFWNDVSVSTWRNWLLRTNGVKAATRKSADMKAAVKAVMYDLFRLKIENDNEHDAMGIAIWANQHLRSQSEAS